MLALFLLLASSPGQQQILRPLLEAAFANKLKGDVILDRLELTLYSARLTGLQVQLGPGHKLEVQETFVRWSWKSLKRKQLELVQIFRPEMTLEIVSDRRSSSALDLPVVPIRQLMLANGVVRIHRENQRYLIRELQAQIRTQDKTAPFLLTGKLGPEALPLAVEGQLIPGEPARLLLQQAHLDAQELLPRAVLFTLDPTADTPGVQLQLDQIDSDEVQRLIRALQFDWPLPEALSFSLQQPRLEWNRQNDPPLHLNLTSAQVQWDRKSINVGQGQIGVRLGKQLELEGQLNLPGESHLQFSLVPGTESRATIELKIPQPAALARAVLPDWQWPIQGRLNAGGEVFLTGEDRWEGAFHLVGKPDPAKQKRRKEAFQLGGVEAGLQFAASGNRWEGRLDTRIANRALFRARGDSERWSWELFSNKASTWRRLLPRGLWPTRLKDFEGLAGKGIFQRQPSSWSGNGTIELRKAVWGRFQLEDGQSSWRIFGSPQKWTFHTEKSSARFGGEGLPTGRIQAQGVWKQTPGGTQLTLEDLRMQDVGYLSPDGFRGLGGGVLAARGKILQRGNHWELDLQGDLGVREILSGAFYAETGAWPGLWRLKGHYDNLAARLSITEGRLTSKGMGDARFTGTLSANQQDLQGDFQLTGLEKALAPLLRQALEGVNPQMADIDLVGRISGQGEFHRSPKGWIVQGDFSPHDLILSWPHIGLWLETSRGKLPISLGTKPGARLSPQSARLHIQALRLGPLNLKTDMLTLETARNQLKIPGTQRWSLAQGAALVDDLVLRGGGQPFQMETGIRVEGVQLTDLTQEMNWPSMAGTLDADLGRMTYRDSSVRSEGTAQIQAFGGDIRLDRMRATDLFGAYPGFEVNLSFSGIDLQKLTQTLAFGEMNGIVDGYAHNLRLLGATPSRFEARIESRDKGPRDISVRALDNLTVVSQGTSSSALSRGIYRFIPRYNYRKLGLQCRLENDRFFLRGIARKDSDRYLVDGGFWPPKIDIVSPPATVSFKEMLRRLQRIDRQAR